MINYKSIANNDKFSLQTMNEDMERMDLLEERIFQQLNTMTTTLVDKYTSHLEKTVRKMFEKAEFINNAINPEREDLLYLTKNIKFDAPNYICDKDYPITLIKENDDDYNFTIYNRPNTSFTELALGLIKVQLTQKEDLLGEIATNLLATNKELSEKMIEVQKGLKTSEEQYKKLR